MRDRNISSKVRLGCYVQEPKIPRRHASLLAGVGKDGPPSVIAPYNDLAKKAGKGRRILVIEDDDNSLELYDLLLRSFGYATLLASSGEEGLAMAQSARPDLILCDIRLPGLGGMEVMRLLKANASLAHIPIFAVTVFASEGNRERLLAAGFDGYLAKPTDPEEFIREINDFFSHN